MGLTVNSVFVLVCVLSVVNCLPKPRDSTVSHSKDSIKTEIEPVNKSVEGSSNATTVLHSENPITAEIEPVNKSVEEASTVNTVLHSENPIKTEIEPVNKSIEESATAKDQNPENLIPGRIACEHIEATEDLICQEHCIPKGYAYGLCVSKTCSCV